MRSFESRFEWWRPERLREGANGHAAEGGGILYDLGAHLIDQAMQLFGPVEESYGETANHGPHPDGADTEAFVSLLHESGVRSRLWMNGMAAQVGPRFHVLGSGAGYTKWGLDSQEPALAAGMTPSDPALRRGAPGLLGALGVDGATTAGRGRNGRLPRSSTQARGSPPGPGPAARRPAKSHSSPEDHREIHAFA